MVDDEEDARDLVQRLLEDAGARVSACDTAQSALQTIENGLVPDVIVSDVAMPEQDGYDFMKRVRQMQAPNSVVLAATCRPTSQRLQQVRSDSSTQSTM